MPRIIKIDPLSPDEALLSEAADIVKSGGVIIYPTETVYGIGALYSNERAIQRIFSIKGRDAHRPILLLLRNLNDLERLATGISEKALSFAKRYWPGPVTLLFHAKPFLSDFLIGQEKKIGCRISDNPLTQKLLNHIGAPITSTSANPSGIHENYCNINKLPDIIYKSVDAILDAGAVGGGVPSTVIDVTQEPFKILRRGAIIPDDPSFKIVSE